MKKIKRLSIFLAIVLLLSSFSFLVSAEKPQSIYEETHEQINMKNLKLEKKNDKIEIKVKDCNFISKKIAKDKKEKLEKDFIKYPQFENTIAKVIDENSELCAISYTEAPLELNEDNELVRVKKRKQSLLLRMLSTFTVKADALDMVAGASSPEETYGDGKSLFLTTFILKSSTGEYTSVTYGGWLLGSWTGGSKYPASGKDTIMQTIPTSMFLRSNYDFECQYTKTGEDELVDAYWGKQGTEYTIRDFVDNCTRIEIKDDPLGLDRLYSFKLTTYSTEIEKVNGPRKIYSYYVHTWNVVDATFNLTMTPIYDPDSKEDKYEYQFSITPSIKDRSWTVCNTVDFDF